MNKQAIIEALATTSGISKAQAERNLDALLTVMRRGLTDNGEFTFSGIGKLKVINRQARTGRNPNTGAALQIPARKTVRFRQSSNLEV